MPPRRGTTRRLRPAEPPSAIRFTTELLLHATAQRAELAPSTSTNTKKAKVDTTEMALDDGHSVSTPLDDALHAYSCALRPSDEEGLVVLTLLIRRIATLCGAFPENWKLFVLHAAQRRYHTKAPVAKQGEAAVAAKYAAAAGGESAAGDEDEAAAAAKDAAAESDGDGERLIFYMTALVLAQLERLGNAHAGKALLCLVRLAMPLGGTRDVSTMIEHLVAAHLLEAAAGPPMVTVSPGAKPPCGFKASLIPCLRRCTAASMAPALNELLATCSSTLHADLVLLTSHSAAGTATEKATEKATATEKEALMSTMHVFVPHNGRGNSSGSSWQRNIFQTVAEHLIWSSVPEAARDGRFSVAQQQMDELATAGMDEKLVEWGSALQRTQTTVRKLKQSLNVRARQQGFQLCSLFLMDPSLVTYRMVCRGKAGDIAALGRLTRKVKDVRVLGMIAKRGLASQKAVPAESMQALISAWTDLFPASSDVIEAGGEDEEVLSLERAICEQTVAATLAALRKKQQKKKGQGAAKSRPKVILAVDNDSANIVAALFIAAALGSEDTPVEAAALGSEEPVPVVVSTVRLLVSGKDVDVFGPGALLHALNTVIVHGPGALVAEASPSFSTTQLLETEVVVPAEASGEGVDAMVFCSADISLDECFLRRITASGSTVHVHAAVALRKAGKGLASVTLATSIGDKLKAGAPLTVSVMLDCTGSMGSEIEGCKKGALELISQFNALSEVRAANFSGYWDEIGSRGDPKPASTGFIDPRPASGTAKIKAFVEKELRCTGGGDEPEDIPAAFDKFIVDLDKYGITSSGDPSPSVDFLFLIADAGFRDNELARVQRLSAELARRGVVFCLCPTRFHGGSSQATFQTLRDAFQPGGQLIELSDVGQLSDIAATVTGAIKASLFGAGNVVSVTSSVGGTVDALAALCRLGSDVDELKKIKELTAGKAEEGEGEGDAPVVVGKARFELTARERSHLQLSRLPPICHATVAGVFGGDSLMETMAASVANQLMDSNLGIGDLQSAGYPDDVVELVKLRMQHQMGAQVEGEVAAGAGGSEVMQVLMQ